MGRTSGANSGRNGGSGADGDGRVGRLDAALEAEIVRSYEAWDGRAPRLDDFLAGFGISRPTLYAVLRRNGRPTKRDLLLRARERVRALDPDPSGDGADPPRAADAARHWEAEARRWETEARRLRALLVAHGIDPETAA